MNLYLFILINNIKDILINIIITKQLIVFFPVFKELLEVILSIL